MNGNMADLDTIKTYMPVSEVHIGRRQILAVLQCPAARCRKYFDLYELPPEGGFMFTDCPHCGETIRIVARVY